MMQNTQKKYSKTTNVESLLEEVYNYLTELTEENFQEKFPAASAKMELVRQIKHENSVNWHNIQASKKIVQMTKLISDKYDNVIKDWADRLKVVQKEIELTQNQKKITIYNR